MPVKSSPLNLGFLVPFIIFYSANECVGESSTCLTIYKEGGAPAVFQSSKCPRWNLQDRGSRTRTAGNSCQTAVLQGRRKHQEDRVLCAFDMRIPFPSKAGPRDVVVGIAAVFDGHNGAEASEMASKLLLDYFALHTYFLLDATYTVVSNKLMGRLPCKEEEEHDLLLHHLDRDRVVHQHQLNFERFRFTLPLNFDDSFHLDILKEALLRAIHDIDATFSQEATRRNLDSGSTAVIALIADGQLLVANIGDSKALLCSEKFETPEEARATLLKYRVQRRNGEISPSRVYDLKLKSSDGIVQYRAKELTVDHHPDREDEKIRVEASGGSVLEWGGVPRVNGQLAVSRSIGDMSFKSYGVISVPEVLDWQPLMANDSYIVVASDGIFEKLYLQDVCDLLLEIDSHDSSETRHCSFSLADCLVNTAFEKGSMDNMAAVVVPLQSPVISPPPFMDQCSSDSTYNFASMLQHNNTYALSWQADVNSSRSELKRDHPHATMFNRLLIEGKNSSFRCFYMSENLNANVDYDVLPDDSKHRMNDYLQALPASSESFSGSDLVDQGSCMAYGITSHESQDQCINPESFASFLRLLESIPLLDTDSKNGSNEFPFPDSRYKLRKRYGRGSYGEVWLAFHWNCYQGSNASRWSSDYENISKSDSHINEHISDLAGNASSSSHNDADFPDTFFILKRIMIERGPGFYLSGLREKHFGELFLSACNNNSLGSVSSEEGLEHIVRYIESFESRYNDIWLVFRHEGVSLSKLMYTVEEAETYGEEARHVQILRPSKWWIWLKTTDSGKEEMKSIIWQLLLALKSCHDRNITHRDIKPENMVICHEDQVTGRCSKGVPEGVKKFKTKMRIIDFGSALDEFTMKHFYGSAGPSRAEQTREYAAPEAILNSSWHRGPTSMTMKYDMWSVGVVMLEMILGSPNVFEISSVTRAHLDPHIEGWSDDLKELAYKLRSFMELCILIPGSSVKGRGSRSKQGGEMSPALWKCSEEFFAQQIKRRDPLKIGEGRFPDAWALRLVWHLLSWDPEERMSVDDALQHPYFHSLPTSFV